MGKHQVTYLRDSSGSVSGNEDAGDVANLLLGGVDDLASLHGDRTLSWNLILRVGGRILDDRLASLQRFAGATAHGDRLSGLSGSGRPRLGLNSICCSVKSPKTIRIRVSGIDCNMSGTGHWIDVQFGVWYASLCVEDVVCRMTNGHSPNDGAED